VSIRTDERGKLLKALPICFLRAINIQMIGISRSDDSNPWFQPMEEVISSASTTVILLFSESNNYLLYFSDTPKKALQSTCDCRKR
jgi:hypothetical protein